MYGNEGQERIQNKLYGDMLSSCVNRVEDNIVKNVKILI
jgi:hypothetical protein